MTLDEFKTALGPGARVEQHHTSQGPMLHIMSGRDTLGCRHCCGKAVSPDLCTPEILCADAQLALDTPEDRARFVASVVASRLEE